MSVFFFIAASGFFLATNFLYFVWDVIWYLGSSSESSETTTATSNISQGTQTVLAVLRFVFVQGSFLGLILCYWRFPAPETHFDEVDIDRRVIDRGGVMPREVEGTPITEIPGQEAKEKTFGTGDPVFVTQKHEGILEADGSKGILEADGSKSVWEADSKTVHETA